MKIEVSGSVIGTALDVSAASLLQLYSGPRVVVRIGSAGREYRFPKALLCAQVPYFAAAFEKRRFKEGVEQSITLEEIDGVLSSGSFEMLVSWVCTKHVVFNNSPATFAITSLVEFARLADYLKVTGMEALLAAQIERLVKNATYDSGIEGDVLTPDLHLFGVTFGHIKSSIMLSQKHPVREILASAAVKGCLLNYNSLFFKQIQTLPDFAVDLLPKVSAALGNPVTNKRGIGFRDPFDGSLIYL